MRAEAVAPVAWGASEPGFASVDFPSLPTALPWSIQALLLHARQLPRHSALIDAPRVILRLACWNSDGRPPTPSSRNPLKLRSTHAVPMAARGP